MSATYVAIISTGIAFAGFILAICKIVYDMGKLHHIAESTEKEAARNNEEIKLIRERMASLKLLDGGHIERQFDSIREKNDAQDSMIGELNAGVVRIETNLEVVMRDISDMKNKFDLFLGRGG
jgi:archaellum component FlaC